MDINKEIILETKCVSKRYVHTNIEEPALNEVSIAFARGEFVAITGKSGSGKSTLLNLLSGIDRVSTGEIFYKKTSISAMNESALTKWRGENVGIIFQFFQLIPTLTVIENVMLPMDFLAKYKGQQKGKRAFELLEIAEIQHLANKFPFDLSGGEQQRVAIARAMSNDPDIIFADEPTGNLDSTTTESIMRLFLALIDAGKTIFMVTHNNDLTVLANRVITLRDGCVVNDIYNR